MTIHRDPNDPGFPVHPGEMLREEFMGPVGLSTVELANALQVPEAKIADLVQERGSIDAELAYRLQLYFGMTVGFWIGLQTDYDLGKLRYSDQYQQLVAQVKPRAKSEELAGAA